MSMKLRRLCAAWIAAALFSGATYGAGEVSTKPDGKAEHKVVAASLPWPTFNDHWRDLPDSQNPSAAKFYDYVQTLYPHIAERELDAITDMNGGTTSVFFKFNHMTVKGEWRPRSGASQIEGIVFAFNLSRLLKMNPGFVKTAIEMPLPATSPSIRAFMSYLEKTHYSGKSKEANRRAFLKSTSGKMAINGVLSLRGEKDYPFDDLRMKGMGNGALNTKHRFSKLLDCGVEIPAGSEKLTIVVDGKRKDLYASSRDIAAQLSNMLVLDALNLQWDRFSGGNIEFVEVEGNQFMFVVNDNGGTSNEYSGYAKQYAQKIMASWVKRFDSKTAGRLVEIHEFINHRGNLDEFKDEHHLKQALGVIDGSNNWNNKWEGFRLVLSEMVKTIESGPKECLI